MISNIKNNTISEANAKKKINELNKTQKVETIGKRLIKCQEKLLSLFGDLVEAILNNNNDKDLSENVSENESKNVSENKSENVNENESENENDDDDEFYELKQLNKHFKTIDQTK